MKRRCEKCPPEVRAVCRHVFGKFWDVRSRNGEGCDHPLDDVAEAWRRAGWKPRDEEPKMPRRPEVSARIAQQAELFFGRAKK